VLGIDAGGTRIRAVLTDLEGTVRASATGVVRSARRADGILDAIADLAAWARSSMPRDRVLAAGAGISGIVDQPSGTVLLSPDLPGLEGLAVADQLEERLGLPVGIDNDDVLAAVGEASFGAARGCSDVVFLSLGLGLGAGLIVGGRPVRGARSAAGAIAYLAPGRLEELASGRVIPRRYQKLAGLEESRTRDLDAREVFRRAETGDQAAAKVIAEATEALGHLVVNVAALIDPEIIVVGGGLSESGPRLIERLAERLARSVPYPPRLVRSELGEEAVGLGAAALALTLAKQRLAERSRPISIHAEPARMGALELV
jgi:predicted NBD/HSP70 family sugar kinase